MPAFRVKLGANDLKFVDVPLNRTHSLTDWQLNAVYLIFYKKQQLQLPAMCLQSNFVRHNTPHPKELRSRHSKLLNKDIDGHVIAHDPHEDQVSIDDWR